MIEDKPPSKIAVITGASSGIGTAFAKELASQGYNLIIIARREQRLKELARILKEKHETNVEIIIADLSQIDDIEIITQRLEKIEKIDLLVNNAGFGLSGKFVDTEKTKLFDMIYVHDLASFSFCRAVLPNMLKRNQGSIINVSSMSGLMIKYGNVTYTVTKAFLISLSESLQEELRNTKIKIQALCPGMTKSGFHDTKELTSFNKNLVPKGLWMNSETLVKKSLAALNKKKTVYIPGFRNKLIVKISNNLFTGKIIRYLAYKRLKS